MGGPSVLHVTSLDQLRGAGARWDDLWQRSDVTLPNARAELIAHWIEQFAPVHEFQALAVEEGGHWVAALPLVGSRVAGVLRAGTLPVNPWAYGGGLLLDCSADRAAVLEALVRAMRDLPWHVMWLDEVPLDSPQWALFRKALARNGTPSSWHARYDVGLIELCGAWEPYWRSLSSHHRQNIGNAGRRLARRGEVRFDLETNPSREQVETLLYSGFEVEDRSWKGRTGSSVFRRRMFPFYLRQARQLAEWGHLALAFLRFSGRPIAFCYGMIAKGVFHYCKIGYDPDFASYSPGQLLLNDLLQRLREDPICRAVDTLGEVTDATARWKPSIYRVGQIVLPSRRLLGRMAVYGHKHLWPHVRRFRSRFGARRGLNGHTHDPTPDALSAEAARPSETPT